MSFGYVLLGKVLLYVLGAIWCKEVIGRFHSDVTEFKGARDAGHKGVIVFIWMLTLGIMILMATVAVYTIVTIVKDS